MDAKKLGKWAELLLDTGKRNNLINFKDTKTSTVEVLLPAAEVLFGKIDGATAFEVFDPKISEKEDDLIIEDVAAEQIGIPQSEEENEPIAEDVVVEQIDILQSEEVPPAQIDIFAELDKPFEILLPSAEKAPAEEVVPVQGQEEDVAPSDSDKAAFMAQYARKIKKQSQMLVYNATNPLAAIKSIDKKAREYIEETGVNVAYMAFGFIHWTENKSSRYTFHAPILLVPIQLSQASAVDPYIIKSTGDDVVVNPTFSYKLEAEYGVKLPEYNHEGLREYIEKVRTIVSKLQWTITEEVKIGIFSFLKINMYRDLKDNSKAILSNNNVRMLLGEPLIAENDSEASGDDKSIRDPLIDLHSVVDADSSQIEAIEMAKAGKSFVLQGPPGTGKSQTITNIIAECLSDGKKVLFVSEKLAALNVVYDKLKQAGLSEFCLELHSHKANKKSVISDICHTLRAGRSGVSSKADAEIALKEKAKKQLDAYAVELHKQRPVIGKSLYQMYEAYAAYRAEPDVEWEMDDIATRGESYLTDTGILLEEYVDFIPSIGYDYRLNPWYGYIGQDTSNLARVSLKNSITAVLPFLESLNRIIQKFADQYNVRCCSVEDARVWQRFLQLAASSQFITSSLLRESTFNTVSASAKELQECSNAILPSRKVLDAQFDEDIYKLNGASYYKKLTRQFDGMFSRLFNAEYKKIISDLRICKKDGKKVSYNEAVAVTQRLAFYQEKCADFAKAEAPAKMYLGQGYKGVHTNWSTVMEEMAAIKAIFSSGISFGGLAETITFAHEKEDFAAWAHQFKGVLDTCNENALCGVANYFDNAIFDPFVASCALVTARLEDCLNEMHKLDNWCQFRAVLSNLADFNAVSYINMAIAANVEPKHIVGAFKKAFYCQWIDMTIAKASALALFSRISQDRAVHSFSEKDTEQFDISKAKIRAELSAMRPPLDMIASGSSLAILLREGEKKSKQKNIRTLLQETGDVVQRVKPCFLMSPLSVSTYLAPNSVHFDVVIFDEASQIFPQDAIGAIYRGKQLIVVGDSKQMPPSNFFNATIETDNNDEEAGDVTDFESILDLCSTSMPQIRLRWHYRSRFEQLITFSNKNFYDNDLVTFPSSKADAPGVGVDYFYVDGTFDRKSHTNRKEAEFIVDLIYQHIDKFPERSLGVVAFSVAQQDLIDKLLSKRRQSTPEKEYFFRRDGSDPFFIKNLETVQGDERDTIIFSVAYGKDTQGRLLHNFGPLNRAGGERRLNVAVTRARCNVQLVSSMHHTDIDLNRTSAEGARLLREYLDYAENGAVALERSISVGAYEQFDSDFELEVCEFLRSRGFSVDTQVGCSGFKIDLGLKLPDSSDYVLAIECDGATYHSSKNARDRDRLRQAILERMGWKFYRIWSTDWFRNKEVEKERLLTAAIDAVKHPDRKTSNPSKDRPEVSFEETMSEAHFNFLPYRAVNVQYVCKKHPRQVKAIVREILECEAPLSEELLLRRMSWYYGREKVTNVVWRAFEEDMEGCERYGIIRANGFLYLSEEHPIVFRRPGNLQREIKHIAPEELAAGMLDILRLNGTVEKSSLYRLLATQCGFARGGKNIQEYMDAALEVLEDRIHINDDQISLK